MLYWYCSGRSRSWPSMPRPAEAKGHSCNRRVGGQAMTRKQRLWSPRLLAAKSPRRRLLQRAVRPAMRPHKHALGRVSPHMPAGGLARPAAHLVVGEVAVAGAIHLPPALVDIHHRDLAVCQVRNCRLIEGDCRVAEAADQQQAGGRAGRRAGAEPSMLCGGGGHLYAAHVHSRRALDAPAFPPAFAQPPRATSNSHECNSSNKR